MATLESIGIDLQTPDAHGRPVYRRLGLLNGIFIGLALAAGASAQEAMRGVQLPVRLYLPMLLLASHVVVS